jgi:hypothetical protein
LVDLLLQEARENTVDLVDEDPAIMGRELIYLYKPFNQGITQALKARTILMVNSELTTCPLVDDLARNLLPVLLAMVS